MCRADSFVLVRDAETEYFLTEITQEMRPFLSKPRFFIIGDQSMNAFTAGGLDVYTHIGLISRIENYEQLSGVLAHELAHVDLGHVARMREEYRKIKKIAVIMNMAGLATAMTNTDLGLGIMSAGDYATYASFMRYSRMNEIAADLKALEYMTNADNNPIALSDALKLIELNSHNNSLLSLPYLKSHPDPGWRANRIKNSVSALLFKQNDAKKERQKKFMRIRAKIDAFFGNETETIARYEKDYCINSYVKSILLSKKGKHNDAIDSISEVLQSCYPEDPYILELLAQFLYDARRYQESVIMYRKSLDYLNTDEDSLIRENLGFAILNTENPLIDAEREFRKVLTKDQDSPRAWIGLAMVLDKMGNASGSQIALVESDIASGNFHSAIKRMKMIRSYKMTISEQDLQSIEKRLHERMVN